MTAKKKDKINYERILITEEHELTWEDGEPIDPLIEELNELRAHYPETQGHSVFISTRCSYYRGRDDDLHAGTDETVATIDHMETDGEYAERIKRLERNEAARAAKAKTASVKRFAASAKALIEEDRQLRQDDQRR